MIHQLRIYQVNPNLLAEFDARFKDHAKRIMERYGFRVTSMWYSRVKDRVEFIYILQWDDAAQMQAQWAAFMADQEWEKIKAHSRSTTGEPVVAKLVDQVLTDSY